VAQGRAGSQPAAAGETGIAGRTAGEELQTEKMVRRGPPACANQGAGGSRLRGCSRNAFVGWGAAASCGRQQHAAGSRQVPASFAPPELACARHGFTGQVTADGQPGGRPMLVIRRQGEEPPHHTPPSAVRPSAKRSERERDETGRQGRAAALPPGLDRTAACWRAAERQQLTGKLRGSRFYSNKIGFCLTLKMSSTPNQNK
jgi:hypothetical protein